MTVEVLELTTEQRVTELENQLYAIHMDHKYKPHDEKIKRVTYEQYAEAVVKLFKLAKMNCGGSYYAAQVLLSLYNGSEFHVDLAHVAGGLDGNYLDAVLVAIKGRGILMKEPHEVIKDGSEHFRKLWRNWEKELHINHRYQ